MKRWFYGFVVLMVLCSVQSVHALQDWYYGVSVIVDTCTYDNPGFDGGYDLLVVKSEIDEHYEYSSTVTSNFSDHYNTIVEFEYTKDTYDEFVPFAAYYVNSNDNSVFASEESCSINFGNDETMSKLSKIKLVHFDQNGDTVFISDEIEVPSVRFFQKPDYKVIYNPDTEDLLVEMDVDTDVGFVLMMLFFAALAVQVVVFKVVVALLLRMKQNSIYQTIGFYNFAVFYCGIIYLFVVADETIAQETNFIWYLIISLLLIMVTESGLLYLRFKTILDIKKLVLYEMITSGVAILLLLFAAIIG